MAAALSWLWFTLVALLIGVQPGQFVGLLVLGRMVESLSHANIRLHFGWLGDRLLVSPAYHRMHHAVGIGHEGRYYGCNFASLFPVWDLLFRTANFNFSYEETGIRDQVEAHRDYGQSFENNDLGPEPSVQTQGLEHYNLPGSAMSSHFSFTCRCPLHG